MPNMRRLSEMIRKPFGDPAMNVPSFHVDTLDSFPLWRVVHKSGARAYSNPV